MPRIPTFNGYIEFQCSFQVTDKLLYQETEFKCLYIVIKSFFVYDKCPVFKVYKKNNLGEYIFKKIIIGGTQR